MSRKDKELYELAVNSLAELYALLPGEISRALIFSTIHVDALNSWHSSTKTDARGEEKKEN